MSVANVLRHVRPAHVVVALEAESRDDVVRDLAGLMVSSGALSKGKGDALVTEVLGREGEGTTGIGGGVAVPHAKTALVRELVVAVGLSARGIEWASVDGDRVHVVFLIASPPDANQEYLALMRWVVSLTRSKYWMKFLRGCATPAAVVEVLEESFANPAGGR
jgi:mannitol/fructose-specific phosphotransferase system IIA component (Ntr-type)